MNNIEMIKCDLETLDPTEFYYKHIVKSQNWYFSEYLKIPSEEIIDKMDYFKEIVSKSFKINFHNLQIVGSAKVGYSLSPQKLLKPFHDEADGVSSSDIDIAVISEKLFVMFWDKLRKVRGIRYRHFYNHLTESIFRGYINDKDLIHIDEIKKEWDYLSSPVNIDLQDKLRFIHPITYRIYRNWDDLQEYQIIGITKAKNELEGNSNV